MIVKCSHCKQMFDEKDFDAHECDMPLKECRRIEVAYFRDDSYMNKRLMTGRGIDGTLYTFEVVIREPIPMTISASDGFLQPKKPDKDFTKPGDKSLSA